MQNTLIGYRFKEWDDHCTDNPRQVVACENRKYVAIFEPVYKRSYSIYRDIGKNCHTTEIAQCVEEGSFYQEIVTADPGYRLTVTCDMSGTAVKIQDGQVNVPNVIGDLTITAFASPV